jgi:hypothetical protein
MQISFIDITIGLDLFNSLITVFTGYFGYCDLEVILLESLAPFFIMR